jgi:hypothetical protein
MVGKAIDRNRQALSIYAVPMKRLLTEGITDEMLNHCTTRFNLMAFIKYQAGGVYVQPGVWVKVFQFIQ